MSFMRQPELESLGPLKVARVRGKESGPTIVLFHGYGASAYDLYPLHQALSAPSGTNWIFPDGHLEIPIGPGYFGRAWFPIDMEALQRAMMTGEVRDLSGKEPQGLRIAREKAMEMLSYLDIPFSEIFIGGFSQGAMLSVDLSLRHKEIPKGLAILSGTLLNKSVWTELAKTKSAMTFFQSHGKLDPVLGYGLAKDLNQMLRDSGMIGEFVSFSGGHEIPWEVLEGLNRYIQVRLGE
jgi:phospholipase/carboxylesterase